MASSWSTAEVGEWLASSGMASFVERFKEEEIDGFALLNLTEEDINGIFVKAGPRAKFRSILKEVKDKQLKPKTQELKKGEPSEEECSPSASLNDSRSLSMETVKEKLETIRKKRLERSSVKTEEPMKKKKKKDTYRILFGWMRRDKGRLKYVMPRQGGGAKKCDVQRDTSYSGLLDIGKNLYGINETEDTYLGNFKGDPYDKTLTCHHLAHQSNFLTTPRLYIISQNQHDVRSAEEEYPKQPPVLTPQKDPQKPTTSHDMDTTVVSMVEVEKYLLAEVLEEKSDKNDDRHKGELADTCNADTPVYTRNAAVSYFIDMKEEEGKLFKKVNSGWGEFVLLPQEDFDEFIQVRSDLEIEKLAIVNPPLLYFLGNYNEVVHVHVLSKNVVELDLKVINEYQRWCLEIKEKLSLDLN